MLGLDKGRVDADGTGKLGERGSGNIDALALHLETIEVAIWDVSLIPEWPVKCWRVPTYADFWLIEVSNLLHRIHLVSPADSR